MKKREAKFQTTLNHYVRYREIHGAFELKQTTTDSIPFDDVKEHQLRGLRAFRKAGLVWKLSDQDQRQKPFDSLHVPPMEAYVVIKFPSICVFIPIMIFLWEKKKSKRKSLTVEKAMELAVYKFNSISSR